MTGNRSGLPADATLGSVPNPDLQALMHVGVDLESVSLFEIPLLLQLESGTGRMFNAQLLQTALRRCKSFGNPASSAPMTSSVFRDPALLYL